MVSIVEVSNLRTHSCITNKLQHIFMIGTGATGPSPPIKKWSGGGSHRVPKAREVGEHERGVIPPLVRGGAWGPPTREFLNF